VRCGLRVVSIWNVVAAVGVPEKCDYLKQYVLQAGKSGYDMHETEILGDRYEVGVIGRAPQPRLGEVISRTRRGLGLRAAGISGNLTSSPAPKSVE
ncbi:MAG: hypothetical protein QOH34_694, partial [Mycobacterium sp.]|nr:hypothetical protein [Mycobacterium sp.]